MFPPNVEKINLVYEQADLVLVSILHCRVHCLTNEITITHGCCTITGTFLRIAPCSSTANLRVNYSSQVSSKPLLHFSQLSLPRLYDTLELIGTGESCITLTRLEIKF